MGNNIERIVYDEKGRMVAARCCRCKDTKPITEYYLSGNGMPYRLCKQCVKEKNKERSNSNRRIYGEYIYDDNGNIVQKKCCLCGEFKDLNEFYYDKKRQSYHSYCRMCRKIKNREYSRTYSRIYKKARYQSPVIADDKQEKENPHMYKGVYVLINPELRRCII